jgi:hypothetical protein
MPESGPVDLNALVVRLDPAAHRAMSIELVQMIVD